MSVTNVMMNAVCSWLRIGAVMDLLFFVSGRVWLCSSYPKDMACILKDSPILVLKTLMLYIGDWARFVHDTDVSVGMWLLDRPMRHCSILQQISVVCHYHCWD